MSLQFRDKDSKNNRCYNIISEKNLSDWNTDRIRPLSIIIISGIPKKLADSANYIITISKTDKAALVL